MVDETELLLDDLELRISRLKILYEQYFLGMEKAEPVIARKEVMRMMQTLQNTQIRNTALRFRHNNLKQRWNTYQTRWSKTLREIEQGTYSRHVARAQRKGVELPPEVVAKLHLGSAHDAPTTPQTPTDRAPAGHDNSLVGLLDELDDGGGSFVFEGTPSQSARAGTSKAPTTGGLPPPPPQSVTPPPPPGRFGPPPIPGGPPPIPGGAPPLIARTVPPPMGAVTGPPPTGAVTSPPPSPSGPARRPTIPPPLPPQRTPPPSSPIPGMSESDLRALHERYQQARRTVGKAGGEVNYQSFVSSLQRQVPEILSKHKCALVDFDVQVKDDKVILKAQPKR